MKTIAAAMAEPITERMIPRSSRSSGFDCEVDALTSKLSPADYGLKPEVLCVIPARGGSKGIPHKNIALLAGKPLIAYSIEVAMRTPEVSRVIVSTEDERIAEIAMQCGAEVPFLRPRDLAGDDSVAGSVIGHLLDTLAQRENYRPQAYVTLYPTSPLRSVSLTGFLTRKLFEGFMEVLAAKPLCRSLRYFQDQRDALAPLRQPEPGCDRFRPYGYFYGNRIDNTGVRRRYVHSLDDKVAFVDIDTPEDLAQADRILTRGLFSFS